MTGEVGIAEIVWSAALFGAGFGAINVAFAVALAARDPSRWAMFVIPVVLGPAVVLYVATAGAWVWLSALVLLAVGWVPGMVVWTVLTRTKRRSARAARRTVRRLLD